MNFFYCYITATEKEHVFLYKKPSDNYGKIYINIIGIDRKYYQISGEASKEIVTGTSTGLFYDFESVGMGGDFGNFLTETVDIYIVNRFTGYIRDFFYNPEQKIPLDKKIQQCSFGKESPSPLPKEYTENNPILFIFGTIIFIGILGIYLGQKFFKKSKHKN